MTVAAAPLTKSSGLTIRNHLIGRCGPATGPLLICTGGVHGNEPSGVVALQNVVDHIKSHGVALHGEFAALGGNLAALARGVRFIDRDLNRVWTPTAVDAVLSGAINDSEAREQRALIDILDELLEPRSAPVYYLDLHTTSVSTPPFALHNDTLANRAFAEFLPVPHILGLEERLDGTITDYIVGRGAITVGFEAACHSDPDAVGRHEAAIWMALAGSGLVHRHLPEVLGAHRQLRESTVDLPRVLEIRHRECLDGRVGFVMNPGFKNFQGVSKGQTVAHDEHGPVRCPTSGRLLMPLYQSLGDDGFFISGSVWPFWLTASAALRRLGADRIAHWLPGVHRDTADPNRLIVNPHVARWYTVEIFHLLGYRRRRFEGDFWILARREH